VRTSIRRRAKAHAAAQDNSAGDGEDIAANRRISTTSLSPPKSVSLAARSAVTSGFAKLTPGPCIQPARVRGVCRTRVRTKNTESDRLTENFAAALFTTYLARTGPAFAHPLHRFQRDVRPNRAALERRSKITNFCAPGIRRNAYYHELSRELRTFGYGICNRPRGDFQIEGVPDELAKRFSKRHAQIDQRWRGCWTRSRNLQRDVMPYADCLPPPSGLERERFEPR